MSNLEPRPEEAKAQLDECFARFATAEPGAMIEISYGTSSNLAPIMGRTFPNTEQGRQEAAEFGCATSRSTNVYFGASLRKPGTSGRAKKGDVLGAGMLWADFDDRGASDRARDIYRAGEFSPHGIVITGMKPDMRVQAFWQLDEIISSSEEIDERLAGLHVRLGFVADPKVLNFDRVMRLAGTCSHPKPGKEGRELEVTSWHKPRQAKSGLYTISEVDGLFGRRDAKLARKGQDAPVGGLLDHTPAQTPPTTPSAPAAPQQSPPTANNPFTNAARHTEPSQDALGRWIDGRDDYAMRVIGGAIRNLAAQHERWPSAEEIFNDAWPTYGNGAAPKRPRPGVSHEDGLETEGRGRSWFWEKCQTHAERARSGAISGLETIALAKQRAAEHAASQVQGTGFGGTAPTTPLAGLIAPPTSIRRMPPLILTGGRGVPRRRWLYGRHLIRGFVSITISPGGIGKSSLIYAETLAMTSGRALLGVRVEDPLRVYTWNGEDPLEEVQRRIEGAALHYKLTPESIADRLIAESGREAPLLMGMQVREGAVVNEALVADLIAYFGERHVDVVQVDPFVSSHSVNENDNNAIDAVVKAWGRIAEACNLAVELVHHSKKAAFGQTETTVEDGRGASAMLSAARSARTLNRMTTGEADRFGIEHDERWRYFRVDSGKSSMSPPAELAEWRYLETVDLPNGTESEPGDRVGVVTQWRPPRAFDGVTVEHTQRVKAAIAAAEADGDPYRADPQAKRWAGHVVADVVEIDISNKQGKTRVKKLLEGWIESGELAEVTRQDRHRKNKQMIVCGGEF